MPRYVEVMEPISYTARPHLPTIEELKAYGAEPQWFGLGFIQLKISDTQRYHFWHPNLDDIAPEEEVHDHRYEFNSKVLAGSLTNEIFAFVEAEGGKHSVYSVTCKEGDEPEKLNTGWLTYVATTHMEAGSAYQMPASTFHRSSSEFAITLLTRDTLRLDRARVVRASGGAHVCPFSNKMDTVALWDYIADCLSMAARELKPVHHAAFRDMMSKEPFVPGYHLTEIPKGELGKPSKIVEEALELLDAYEQDSIIMEQVELSDLYGAIEAYLEDRHPNLEMTDVARFSDITKRAFRNGRR